MVPLPADSSTAAVLRSASTLPMDDESEDAPRPNDGLPGCADELDAAAGAGSLAGETNMDFGRCRAAESMGDRGENWPLPLPPPPLPPYEPDTLCVR